MTLWNLTVLSLCFGMHIVKSYSKIFVWQTFTLRKTYWEQNGNNRRIRYSINWIHPSQGCDFWTWLLEYSAFPPSNAECIPGRKQLCAPLTGGCSVTVRAGAICKLFCAMSAACRRSHKWGSVGFRNRLSARNLMPVLTFTEGFPSNFSEMLLNWDSLKQGWMSSWLCQQL